MTIRSQWPAVYVGNTIDAVTAIAASDEKVACFGQFWHPEQTQKQISRLGFRFGAVTKDGGSGLTVSLQDLDLTATTGIARPDEIQDQTVAIANGNVSFATNKWIRTDALSANRTVNYGDVLAVVFEYDGSGRLGADSVQISGIRQIALFNNNGWIRKSGGSWASLATVNPVVALECSDGSFGYLAPTVWAATSVTQRNFASGSTPDERGNSFVCPQNMTVDGLVLFGGPNAMSADFDIVIYESGTAIKTHSVDASSQRVVGTFPQYFQFSTVVELTEGLTYIVSIRPSTATASANAVFEAGFDSASLAESVFGAGCGIVSRTDGGSWSSVTTASLYSMALTLTGVGGGVAGFPLSRVLNRGGSCY